MKKKIPKIGDKAPDFKILTADNNDFQLSLALKSGKNILLAFYRGHW